MRRGLWTAALVFFGAGLMLTASTLLGQPGKKPDKMPVAEPMDKVANPVAKDGPPEFAGKTQPAPGHIAKIAPVPNHPVEEVKVTVGTRVKKDQDLIKLDSDEPEADVRAKKSIVNELEAGLARLQAEPREEDEREARANLENAKINAREMRELLERLEPAFRSGAVSEQKYIEARALVLRCQSDERAAQARLDKILRRAFKHEVAEIEARIVTAKENLKSAEAELEHYLMKSPIDGVVASLTVVLGDVRGHETTVWGEIINLKQLDVRCDVLPEQLDGITVGSDAQVLPAGRNGNGLSGKVINIGIAANRVTGYIPVLIRVENPDEKLRCYIDVKVRFATAKTNK